MSPGLDVESLCIQARKSRSRLRHGSGHYSEEEQQV